MIPSSSNLAISRLIITLSLLLLPKLFFGQINILEQQISIPKYAGVAKKLLNQIGKQADLVLAYSSNTSLNYKVRFEKKRMPLGAFLKQLFEHQPIGYQVKGNKLLLFYKKMPSAPTGQLIKNVVKPKKPILNQTVRGILTDADSELPLVGATIEIIGTNAFKGTVTDEHGQFRLENISLGRISLQVAYLGYETKIIPNIVVNAGKEVVLNLNLQESVVKMDEVVVRAYKDKGKALNEMSIISARSISPEETKRFASPFNDPSRRISNYAGVANTPDGSNDIIIRGNSPKYIQWRLEGVQITNPNHFAEQTGVGSGGISALNNKLLATSDFYTGAFSPEYGDALSGVYDIKIRQGNNEQQEAVFGFGLLGTDFTVEGPFSKNYHGSYLVNYRYSTVAILKELGLIQVNGLPKFQDATFKIMLPTKKLGIFSVFGLAGKSGFSNTDLTGEDAEGIPGQKKAMMASMLKDYQTNTHLFNTGINHTLTINNNGYVHTSFSFSSNGIEDDVFTRKDSTANRLLNFQGRLKKHTYRGAATYHLKLNAKNKIKIGTKYTLFDFNNDQSDLDEDLLARVSLINFDEKISTIRNFISWKYRLNEAITIVSGLHNMNVLFNKKSTLEPRVALNWKVANKRIISAGYGNHSTMESIHNYFTQVKQADGGIIEPNRDLDLLKAHHFVLGFEQQVKKNLRAKVEVYYQHLYNLPVEDNSTSTYATINEGAEYRYVKLVNNGTGKNYGVEITLERFFNAGYYFLWNASLYHSTYKSLEGVVRNTRYDGDYVVNLLAGKEFDNLGKKQNQTLGFNAKVFFGGGKKIIPLLRNSEGKVVVDFENNQFRDFEKAYDNKIEDIYQITLSASYKWNKPKMTHELFLNLDNLTGAKGKISEYYDEREPDNVGYITQLGFFPNLMYRMYF